MFIYFLQPDVRSRQSFDFFVIPIIESDKIKVSAALNLELPPRSRIMKITPLHRNRILCLPFYRVGEMGVR